jgi:hypothetical protein
MTLFEWSTALGVDVRTAKADRRVACYFLKLAD